MDAAVARFSHALAAARRDANLTQEQLSDLSGIHPTEVSRIERGQRDVRISTVARLAQALGLTPGQLLDGPCDALKRR
jgi:transcriptional regulator with XRE-family HTH domain